MEQDEACEKSDTLERADVAAAEDGRTPVNRYPAWPAGATDSKPFPPLTLTRSRGRLEACPTLLFIERSLMPLTADATAEFSGY